MKARQHRERERGFRGIGKPGRGAVKKERANERAVKERETQPRGPKREKR